MTPNLFKSLVFLKVNQKYWDSATVQLAFSKALSDSQTAKVPSMINEDEEFSANLDED